MPRRRAKADRSRAAKLGWARRRAKAARRSLAAVKGWRGRRPPKVQKRAETQARGKLGALERSVKSFERVPVRRPPRRPRIPALPPADLQAAITDAAWEALTGDMQMALGLAREAMRGQRPGMLFAIRARYTLPDGTVRWVSLTALTPLESLEIALVAAREKASQALAPEYWAEVAAEEEVEAGVPDLEEISVYLTDGKSKWT